MINKAQISENGDNISLNTKTIDALEHTPVVGVCAYGGHRITSTGTITYDSLSGTSTDGSTISTLTGKYKASTQGLYTITCSASAYGQTNIYLLKDGVQQDDTLYYSKQDNYDVYYNYEQGSRTVVSIHIYYYFILLFIFQVVCLTKGQEIHLYAYTNTGYISHLQFCVTLESEASC